MGASGSALVGMPRRLPAERAGGERLAAEAGAVPTAATRPGHQGLVTHLPHTQKFCGLDLRTALLTLTPRAGRLINALQATRVMRQMDETGMQSHLRVI